MFPLPTFQWGAVSEYRIFLMNEGGHIVGRIDIEAEDDASAPARGRREVSRERGAEVWQGSRMVGPVPASPRSAIRSGRELAALR